MSKQNEISKILNQAKKLAKKYKAITGKPLGITGEVAEFTAATLLGLKLVEARQAGYDALGKENGKAIKVEIKGRCLSANAKPGQRLGRIKLNEAWDKVVLVLLNEDMEPLELYEASRKDIKKALTVPGSKARNERGQLSVSKFKSIGNSVWPKRSG